MKSKQLNPVSSFAYMAPSSSKYFFASHFSHRRIFCSNIPTTTDCCRVPRKNLFVHISTKSSHAAKTHSIRMNDPHCECSPLHRNIVFYRTSKTAHLIDTDLSEIQSMHEFRPDQTMNRKHKLVQNQGTKNVAFLFAPKNPQNTIKQVESSTTAVNTSSAQITPSIIAGVLAIIALAFIVFSRALKSNKNSLFNIAASAFSPETTASQTGSSASSTNFSKASPKKHEVSRDSVDLLSNLAKKYIIVGGKGGVGKTSMSASLAVKFADRGQCTLIVSTDPAHSLSDAFGEDLSGGTVKKLSAIDNLYAMEIDPESIKQTFNMMGSPQMGGTAASIMGEMGLNDMNALFETLPPGFDEAVALVEVVKFVQSDDPLYSRFQRIVFDTAPTGHTLRLLSLPDFLDSFLGKIMSMRSKFGNMINSMKGMFGGADSNEADPFDAKDMEQFKQSMKVVRELFRDTLQTEFIIACIPNMMAISESVRLLDELDKEGIPVKRVFVNQVQQENNDCVFCAARHKEQRANLQYIRQSFRDMKISPVQFFDREIRGPYALRAMGEQLLPEEKQTPNSASGINSSNQTNVSSSPFSTSSSVSR